MYNRYLRNDQGVYTCVPQEEPRRPPPPHREPSPREPPRDTPPPPPNGGGPEADGGAFREGFQFLDKLLEKLHLQDLDGADLMLLLLLFFLRFPFFFFCINLKWNMDGKCSSLFHFTHHINFTLHLFYKLFHNG